MEKTGFKALCRQPTFQKKSLKKYFIILRIGHLFMSTFQNLKKESKSCFMKLF